MDKKHIEISKQFIAERHRLLAFIRGMIRDPYDAEDILQEVWIRLAQALEQEKEIRSLSKWCRGVAKNLILHFWRDKRTKETVIDEDILDLAEQAFNETDEEPAFWDEKRKALQECMKSLPKESKRLLAMKYEQGFSAEKLGRVLKKKVSSIFMYLSRIRKSVRTCIEQRLKMWEAN
ncbi:RNA polymerase sigma factor [Planctomycetota bacterium]